MENTVNIMKYKKELTLLRQEVLRFTYEDKQNYIRAMGGHEFMPLNISTDYAIRLARCLARAA